VEERRSQTGAIHHSQQFHAWVVEKEEIQTQPETDQAEVPAEGVEIILETLQQEVLVQRVKDRMVAHPFQVMWEVVVEVLVAPEAVEVQEALDLVVLA
jgi:hypothetical protein